MGEGGSFYPHVLLSLLRSLCRKTGGGLGAENYMWTGAIDIILANELVGRTGVGDVLHSALGCSSARAT